MGSGITTTGRPEWAFPCVEPAVEESDALIEPPSLDGGVNRPFDFRSSLRAAQIVQWE